MGPVGQEAGEEEGQRLPVGCPLHLRGCPLPERLSFETLLKAGPTARIRVSDLETRGPRSSQPGE